IPEIKTRQSPLAWSPDGNKIATGIFASNEVMILDAGAGMQPLRSLRTDFGCKSLIWSPDSQMLAIETDGGWEVRNANTGDKQKDENGTAEKPAWWRDALGGNTLYRDDSTGLWLATVGKETIVVDAPLGGGWQTQGTLSTDATRVVAANRSTAKIWDTLN